MIIDLILQRFYQALLIIISVNFLAACSGHYSPLSVEATKAERNTYLVSKIDQLLNEKKLSNKPGISIIVRKNGKTVYERNKGLANIALKQAVTSDTSFKLASISKPITAIAIMQLMERGQLNLTDSLLKWMPELPNHWSEITIHHLLSHQSGIPGYMENVPIKIFYLLDNVDNQKLIQRFINNKNLLFPPESKADYSNSNYLFLAEIIKRSSGMDYYKFLAKNIFIPLGMKSTFINHRPSPDGVVEALHYGKENKIYGATLSTVGAIGISSSTADLTLLSEGLVSGKLISKETLKLMTSPKTDDFIQEKPPWRFYGYGWFLMQENNGSSAFVHRGVMVGYRSYLYINDDANFNYVILGNNGEETSQFIKSIYWVVQNAFN